MKTLLVNEGAINPAKLISVLHYDGTPITARFIMRDIRAKLAALKVIPLRKAVS
jgi:2-oxoglutarate ferredoxin oxidoreductase subunit alpha